MLGQNPASSRGPAYMETTSVRLTMQISDAADTIPDFLEPGSQARYLLPVSHTRREVLLVFVTADEEVQRLQPPQSSLQTNSTICQTRT